ncbi:histidine phosphatase family protein [Sphaerisporangium dianthi]|uniref:Histidine phosphatase family protein n=1 Tax=Sphaerisporangium dianthi TaxID=1436120 RepID=A0ABV9CE69_9ACTN
MRRAEFPDDDEELDERGRREVGLAAARIAAADGHTGPPGTDTGGIAGARIAAATDADAPYRPAPPAALCGPALSCRQTAAGLGLVPVVDHGLRDRDAGHWTGRSLAEIQERDPEGLMAWLTDPAATPHGGESVLTLIDRVAAWLRGLPGRASGKVVAVTHPDVIRAALVHVLAAPPDTFWRLDTEPLAQLSLTARDGRWRLRLSRPV